MLKVQSDSIVNAMAAIVNTTECMHYMGDLIHDGYMLSNVANDKEAVFPLKLTWTLKGNRCGTWLFTEKIPKLQREPNDRIFEIVVEGFNSYGLPHGTINEI